MTFARLSSSVEMTSPGQTWLFALQLAYWEGLPGYSEAEHGTQRLVLPWLAPVTMRNSAMTGWPILCRHWVNHLLHHSKAEAAAYESCLENRVGRSRRLPHRAAHSSRRHSWVGCSNSPHSRHKAERNTRPGNRKGGRSSSSRTDRRAAPVLRGCALAAARR